MSSVFLFGAGASAFSLDCTPAPPPLGKDLFPALRAEGGVVATVDQELARVFEQNFEEGIASFRSKREVDTSALLRDLARYFARFAPGPENLYRTLIRVLISTHHPAVLATINYDLLLELAINAEGRKVTYDGLPVPLDNTPVLKLHGSCNFLPDIAPRQITGIGFEVGPKAAILEAPVKAVSPVEVIQFCDREDSVAPVLALYARGKQVLYCPSFVRRQQRAWRTELNRASRTFVIGVGVNPEDAHIWDPLARSSCQLFYVGPDGATFRAWAKGRRRKRVVYLADSFEEAMSHLPRLLKR